jgi:hypothetical protein
MIVTKSNAKNTIFIGFSDSDLSTGTDLIQNLKPIER